MRDVENKRLELTFESVQGQIDQYQSLIAEMVDDDVISLDSYFEYHDASCSILNSIHGLTGQMGTDPAFDGEDDTRKIMNRWTELRDELDGLRKEQMAKNLSLKDLCLESSVEASVTETTTDLRDSQEDVEVIATAADANKVRKSLDYLSQELMDQRKIFAKSEMKIHPEVASNADELMSAIRLRVERLEVEAERETIGWIQNQLRILREELDQLKDLSDARFV